MIQVFDQLFKGRDDDPTVLPLALVPITKNQWTALAEIGCGSADIALAYFAHKGLSGDRTRMNLAGYPGLLRELNSPAPWEECKPEHFDDMGRYIGPDPETFISAIVQLSDDELRTHLKRDECSLHMQSDEIPRRESIISDADHFDLLYSDIVALGRCLGAEDCLDLANAVFDFDEFTIKPGVPDLLLWDGNGTRGAWCLTEVKAPGDYLAESQFEWLSQYASLVKERIVVTQLVRI